MRPQRSYNPPQDVNQKLDTIFQNVLGETNGQKRLGTADEKFELFTVCAKEFAHAIPNSLLHTIVTLNDVKDFYHTPVDTITPLDRLGNMELPENLHVQTEYHRFHPGTETLMKLEDQFDFFFLFLETDTMFNGQTAFNRSSTIVTGLKYKNKYKGHVQNQTWPFNS